DERSERRSRSRSEKEHASRSRDRSEPHEETSKPREADHSESRRSRSRSEHHESRSRSRDVDRSKDRVAEEHRSDSPHRIGYLHGVVSRCGGCAALSGITRVSDYRDRAA
ncbi:hypothetical protein FOZ62_015376, partial [Perkinsus olseni]